jgi:CubicO group peptidase (beta-lactamase class C family)
MEPSMTVTADRRSSNPKGASRWDEAALQARLDELAAEHHVVAASFGLLHGDEVIEVATGVANLRSGLRATPATLFQIGSITKVYTATLVLQLAERGLLDLDAPVARALPELRLSPPELTEVITVRQLLTHTSGIDGDHFADFGDGHEAIKRYVASCAQLPQLFPPGQMCSYCNAGWVILGRVVEVALGVTWDQALRERLLQPLHCDASFTRAEEAILHPVAIGHLAGEGADLTAPRPTPRWSLPQALGPAGHIVATAGDVLRFARMHLDGGRTGDGVQILDAHTVGAMQQPHVDLIDRMLGDHWALGWFGSQLEGGRSVGHDGGTIGQSAYLRLLPDHNLAAVLLTSGGLGRALYEDLFSEVFVDRAGVTLWRTPAIPESIRSVDLDVYAGTYERYGFRYDIVAGDDRTLTLTPTVTVDEPLLALALLPPMRMVPLENQTFVCSPPVMPQARSTATFAGIENGSAQWVHVGGRLARRVRAAD